MKRIIISLRDRVAVLLLIMFTGGHTFAQVADTLSESDYQAVPHKISRFSTYMYDGTIPHIALGLVFILIIYVGYRYWHDNRPNDVTHTPHHS